MGLKLHILVFKQGVCKMDKFNFEDLLNKFNTDQNQSPLLRLANDWTKISDSAAALAVRCGKLLEDVHGSN